MLTRRIISVLSKQPCVRDYSLSRILYAQGVEHEKHKYSLKEKEKIEKDNPQKPSNVMWISLKSKKEIDFSFGNFSKWLVHKRTEYIKENQSFIPERHEILGADLATAHFIVCRDGRVKFKGNTYWTEKDEKGSYDLPNQYDSRYILEAVDASDTDLYYEGLSNLCGLHKLKWLSLKNCSNIDDWGLDKISAEFPALEHLDISGCEKITERGLESLYRMENLKTLVVTNHFRTVAFELTCFMLEDCMPNLTCEIYTPETIE
ncbi:distal membrane-arm assembly complex protein 2 [Nylanderia fulva]|uniref:distal membrane-arm assembly complex protein 2 n=1 Tax=Nylanderia fulva TaxID=613905 RepID=UPI0010FAD017|nr:distal membrane-arm assembly complex protein 2 [Nylanderia fulva]